MKKRVYSDIDAALQLVEPADIRVPMEKPKDVALRILAKYNELFGEPDMRMVAKKDNDQLSVALKQYYNKHGMLETYQFS
jgi:hypothetical protein